MKGASAILVAVVAVVATARAAAADPVVEPVAPEAATVMIGSVGLAEGHGGSGLVDLAPRIRVFADDEVFGRVAAFITHDVDYNDGGIQLQFTRHVGNPQIGWRHYQHVSDALTLTAEVSVGVGTEAGPPDFALLDFAGDFGKLPSITPAIGVTYHAGALVAGATVGARFILDRDRGRAELQLPFARATVAYRLDDDLTVTGTVGIGVEPPTYALANPTELGAGLWFHDHYGISARAALATTAVALTFDVRSPL